MIEIFYKMKCNFIRTMKSKNGMTLVELVVTFALMALFAVSTTQLLSTAIKTYHQMRGLNDVRQVSDTLLEKITGEIEGARSDFEQTSGENDSSAVIHIYDSGKIIQLRDRTGSKIAITASNDAGTITDRTVTSTYTQNQLLIYYYLLKNDSGGTRYDAVDWTYDAPTGLGFQIDSLTFSQADPTGTVYPKNVIKVVLTMKSDRYANYTATRYVECYNFTTEADFEKIQDDGGNNGGGGTGGGSGSGTSGGSGSGTGGGETGDKTTAGTSVVTIPDSEENQHTLKNSLDWDTVKSTISSSGWNIESGSILTDSTGTYICYNWSKWIRIDDGTEITLEYLASKYPNYFKKLDNTSILIAMDRTVLPNNQGTVWNPLPEAGTICYYEGAYYVAPTQIGKYTMPPGGWVKITNN